MFGAILLVFLGMQSLVDAGMCWKKGVAAGWKKFRCEDFSVLTDYSWWYSWGCDADDFYDNHDCSSVIDSIFSNKFVPMIWGMYKKTDYTCHHGSGATAVLGCNEPNHKQQSSILPEKAADRWPLLQNNATNMTLVSPSAAPCGATHCLANHNTTTWFDAFFARCEGCSFDAIATHKYSCNADATMEFLEMLYERYNKPIWLTEFACRSTNVNQVINYMKAILPRLDSAPYVHRYAWYTSRITNPWGWIKPTASLFEADSSTLTELGWIYQNHTC
ncbi:uncharacterized protein LOC123554236 [Mercenaria mercenaria]|uniref:uncharacterized protein LOC123554236 n=1 Tax=Mercenaria mercenaria TaxID=6596 RepID=UPI001E1D5E4E|nr:uncharacterized protein LOC123554236 [Mercenaria mercenaria]